MRKSLLMLLVVGLSAVSQGCGKSSSAPAGQASSQSPSEASATIKQVASDFLEAIRVGDSVAASSRLTPLAQQVMQQQDMGFDLLENSTATFQVQTVDVIDANEAGVDSVWTELDADGTPMREQWTLGLQRIQGQWRVRGIIADMGANQQPMLMDFENPGQMAAPGNTASTTTPTATPAGTLSPNSAVPQQATRPVAQDPFRQ